MWFVLTDGIKAWVSEREDSEAYTIASGLSRCAAQAQADDLNRS